jgi:prepilin-type N-terminal cleavage/methylation domain-containing protein
MKKINLKNRFKIFHPLGNSKGFTLIEALISMVILSVGILGLSSSVNTVVRFQNKSNNMSQATLLTSQRIEDIKRFGTNELGGGGTFSFAYLVNNQVANPLPGYITAANGFAGTPRLVTATDFPGIFTRVVQIQVWPTNAPNGQNFTNVTTQRAIDMVEVQVTTTWNDTAGNLQTVLSGTVMHKRRFF